MSDRARRYLEDLQVGQEIEIGTWRLDREEVVAFAQQWDPQPFHIDPVAAAASIYGGLVASSLHLFAICTRLFFDCPRPFAVLAMLGKDAIRFPNPARVGDVLTYTTECLEVRPSRSKSDRGVVRLRDRVTNPRGETVLCQEVTLLIARRAPPEVP